MLKKSIVAIFVAVFAFAMVPAAAQAKYCYPKRYVAFGSKKLTWFGARISARYAWKRKVRRRLGYSYSKWFRARYRRLGCTTVGGRKWCRAIAVPCRR